MVNESPANKILINTIAQYVKTILNLALSLYSTRLILSLLGIDNYGIYSLVGGIVSMMTFITSALLTSTQRFLSFNQGKNDISRLKTIFSNSFYIHLFLGLSTAIVLIVCGPIIFDGLVKIPENRIFAAKTIYYIMIVILVITFTGAPVQALLISHENIVLNTIYSDCLHF